MQVSGSELISMAAVRSAAKVIYSPAITVDTPIGLRNDPQTANILAHARHRASELDQAVTQMPPAERSDYQNWIRGENGAHYLKWRARALAVASALELVEQAWEQELATESDNEPATDPTLQRLVDLAWWFDNHGMWLPAAAFLIGFGLFFGIGPARSPLITTITVSMLALAALLIVIYLAGKALPAVVARYAEHIGQELPTTSKISGQEEETNQPPLWEDETSAATNILNHANWAILAQPGKIALSPVKAPKCAYRLEQLKADEPQPQIAALSERQREIALTLVRTKAINSKARPQRGTLETN
ncbi:MAG: hypothetical protein Q4P06_00185 [Actinomycetaceae bacterium]|nr:hypothetical protein [Actinomycetaceae bacterium]